MKKPKVEQIMWAMALINGIFWIAYPLWPGHGDTALILSVIWGCSATIIQRLNQDV